MIEPELLDQLPTLPGSALEFLRLCDDPTAGVAEVAVAAQRDPALLARILQLVNSPFYGTREPIVDVVRASAILGLRNLKMVGVGFAIVGDLWQGMEGSHELSGIISSSAIAGTGAKSFASRIGTGRDDEAFTSGLLSFIGELALLRYHPHEFADEWRTSGGIPDRLRQQERFGTDGVELGRLLLEQWNLPEGLRSGVESRALGIADRTSPRRSSYVASVGFGTALGEVLTKGEGALSHLSPSARRWGIDDADLLKYWSDFRLAVRRTDEELGLGLHKKLDGFVADARAEYLASPFRAGGEFDSARREIMRLRAEAGRLEELSSRDPLTGVLNRAGYNERVRAALARAHRQRDHRDGSAVSIVLFDLDHFKNVNDEHGHKAGDDLLTALSQAAAGATRKNESFARLGGDEFVLLLEPDSAEELRRAAERIRSVMAEAVSSHVHAHGASVSAGAAMLWPSDVDDPVVSENRLFNLADDALYQAKRDGRNRLVFDPSVEQLRPAA